MMYFSSRENKGQKKPEGITEKDTELLNVTNVLLNINEIKSENGISSTFMSC